MAEETKNTAPEAEEVVVSDVPVAEKESEATQVEKLEEEEVKVKETETGKEEESKIVDSGSYKEESNKVDDLIDPEKKALDEFKRLIKEALDKNKFTAPPPPPAEKKEDEPKVEEKKEEPKVEEKKEEPKVEEKMEETETEPEVKEVVKEDEPKSEPKAEAEAEPKEEAVEKKALETVEAVEEIKETIVHEVTAPSEEPAAVSSEEPAAVSIWGIPLLADERSDVILLKFLRARDFKVKEAFAMLKNVVAWRKEFKIDELLEEEGLGEGLDKVVFIHGEDKEGHPVCYNAFGEFQDKELYNNTFSDAEKRAKFLKFYIQFLEKNIRKLDYNPDGICTIVQITDLKNSPGLIMLKKELRQSTNQALQLLQDNYPEFVARQVFINVPWWYLAYNRMISPFLTQRTKSKFMFVGSSRTAETIFKFISPEKVPVQYGGLSKSGEQEFTALDAATEETLKPNGKHTIELPITEACTLVWEVRVIGWDISYGAEFIPTIEDGYTWIVQKSRKIGPNDEQVLSCNFKIGETGKVVLTFDNQTSKKKKLLFRTKTKPSE